MKPPRSSVSVATLLGALLMPVASANDSTEVFHKLDANSDGFISREEARAHPELPDAFDDGDENDDGRLDMSEFSKLEITED